MKDKTAAGLLALFLGGLGAHRFYLGQTRLGVIYLIFCWTYIPMLIGFVDAVIFFIRSDADFDAKYNEGTPQYNPPSNKSFIKSSNGFDPYALVRDLERLHNAEDYEGIIVRFGDEKDFDKLHTSQLPGVYGGLGNAHYKMGNMDKAIAYFERAYAQEPYKMAHKRNLMTMYYEDKQYDKVIEWADKMDLQGLKQAKAWDDFYYVLFKLMGAYEKTEHYELAINALKIAPLKSQYINKDLQDVFWALGDLHEKKGDEKEALKWFQKLHTASPNYENVADAIDRLIGKGIKVRVQNPKHTEETVGLNFPLTGGIDFTAFDFETANTSRTSVCQLGVAVVRAGEIVHAESWLINPKTRTFKFTDLHGIDYDMVKDAPTFGEIWQDIKPLFKGQRIVAHNANGFDVPVLYAMLDKFNIPPIQFKVIDTLYISRDIWSYFNNHKLSTICSELGIELNHHEAKSDAIAAAKILLHALEDASAERKYFMAA